MIDREKQTGLKESSLSERFKDLYQPSLASKRVIDYMAENPFYDSDVFKAAINMKGLSASYTEIMYLVGGVLDSRTQVRRAYETLQRSAGSNGKKIGNILYESAQKNEVHSATEPVEMAYLDNPFALVISVGSEDFKYLHSPDSGGYFMSRLEFYSGNTRLSSPFIAIKRDRAEYIETVLSHEKQHAYNILVKEALISANKGNLWGSDSLTPTERIAATDNAGRLWRQHSTNPDRSALMTSNPDYKKMINHSLSEIKGEMLARLTTGETLNAVVTRLGLYDHLQQDFGMEFSDPFSAFYWHKYTDKLKETFTPVLRAMKTYSRVGLDQRANLLPWMLMRSPVKNWGAELNSVGVTSEVEIIEHILRGKGKLNQGVLNSTQADAAIFQEMVAMQDEPLIPQLVDYWQSIERS